MDNFQINICSRCLDKNKRKVKDSFKKFLKEYGVFLSNYELFVYELLSRNPDEADTVDNLVKIVADEYKSHKLDILKKTYIDEQRIVNTYYRNPNIRSKTYKKKQPNFNKSNKFKVEKTVDNESPNYKLNIPGLEPSKIEELESIVDTPLSYSELVKLKDILRGFDLKQLRFIYSHSLPTDNVSTIINDISERLREFNTDIEFFKAASELELRAYITYIYDKFEGKNPDHIPFYEVIDSFKKDGESLSDVINLDFDELYKRSVEEKNTKTEIKYMKSTGNIVTNHKYHKSTINKNIRISKHKSSPEYSNALKRVKKFIKEYENCTASHNIPLKSEIDDLINEIDKIKDLIKKSSIDKYSREVALNFNGYQKKLKRFPSLYEFIEDMKRYEIDVQLLTKLNPDKYYSKSVRDELKSKTQQCYNNLKYYKNVSWFNYKEFEENHNNLELFLKTYEDLYYYSGLNQENNRVAELNNQFINNEIKDNYHLLKDLDSSQKRAVVVDEDNLQIIAGAGTGKTTTLVNKIKYLIESKGVSPSKILGLSFSNASARDLRKKVNKSLGGKKVEVSTFHKLGINILKENEGEVRTDGKQDILKEVIDNYLTEDLDDEKINQIMKFFAFYFYNSEIPVDEFSTKKELDEYMRGYDFKTLKLKYGGESEKTTLNNERVKSIEELIIANFLFMNNVNYIYEKQFSDDYTYELDNIIFNEFKEDIPINVRMKFLMDLSNYLDISVTKSCLPDFYLTDYNIYLEHYGVDKQCNAKWLTKEGSLKYKKDMNIKKEYFKKHHTRVISTYSFYKTEGVLLQKLEEKLRKEGVILKRRSYEEVYHRLIDQNKKRKEFKDFINLIKTFINLFESKKLSNSEFKKFKKENNKFADHYIKNRNNLFLDIVEDIYLRYQDYKVNDKNRIDFNDMINKGIDSLKSKEYKKYDYILVDEYQDVSYNNNLLLKTLKEDSNAKLVVVGDDWQSIYKFRGSDIELFTKMDKEYGDVERVKLSNNYRCPSKLVNISSKFIMENPLQIKKELSSKVKFEDNPLHIVQTRWDHRFNSEDIFHKRQWLMNVLHYFEEIYGNQLKNKKILILGRYNWDINFLTKGNGSPFSIHKRKKYSMIKYLPLEDLNLEFRTIHSAKGLEADEVIILGLFDKINGFPNKMGIDSVLDFVSVKGSQSDEERRLFYVALTRTKNRVFIFVPNRNKSDFITKEFREQFELFTTEYDIEIPVINEDEPYKIGLKCKKCGGDILILKDYTGNHNFYCSNFPNCDWDGGSYKWINPATVGSFRHCPREGCDGLLIPKGTNGQFGCTFYKDSDKGPCNVMVNDEGIMWKDWDDKTYPDIKEMYVKEDGTLVDSDYFDEDDEE